MEEHKVLVDVRLLRHAVVWLGKLIASEAHHDALCPDHAVRTLHELDKILMEVDHGSRT